MSKSGANQNPLTHVSPEEKRVRRQFGRSRLFHHALGVAGIFASVHFALAAADAHENNSKTDEILNDIGAIATIAVTGFAADGRRKSAANAAVEAALIKSRERSTYGTRDDPSTIFRTGHMAAAAAGSQALGVIGTNIMTAAVSHNSLLPLPDAISFTIGLAAGVVAVGQQIAMHPQDQAVLSNLHLQLMQPSQRFTDPHHPPGKLGGY